MLSDDEYNSLERSRLASLVAASPHLVSCPKCHVVMEKISPNLNDTGVSNGMSDVELQPGDKRKASAPRDGGGKLTHSVLAERGIYGFFNALA